MKKPLLMGGGGLKNKFATKPAVSAPSAPLKKREKKAEVKEASG